MSDDVRRVGAAMVQAMRKCAMVSLCHTDIEWIVDASRPDDIEQMEQILGQAAIDAVRELTPA